MSKPRESKIPAILTQRYDKIVALDEAREILANLSRHENGIDAEIEFIRQRVENLENDLRNSEREAVAIIDRFSNNSTDWTAARLHFIQGYTWEATASKMGVSRDTARMSVYRAFGKASADKASSKGKEV